ncbi:NUDIX domain-containing protein [uncultured Alistipes sp.]|uniref:NUDIX hydrolase n=1 Tax=uncultured Alistipes sp. TaxID=538949 RepID=UPI0026333330|nr:NUDIX domain-containing protein [uncultured Alistipes sp.]
MYKVYIENCAAVFASPEEARGLRGIPSLDADERLSMTKLLQKLQFTKNLAIISENIDRVFEDFRASVPPVEAGGGLVSDARGRVLMIFRNGRWDLPKGKLEAGERIEECAVREVSEECALPLEELRRNDFICHTFHAYRIGDEWVLKRTSWYRMDYTGVRTPSPQTAEGITRVEWIDRERLDGVLEGTYGTIGDVFRQAGYGRCERDGEDRQTE